MCFRVRLYVVVNLYLIAQQNIFFGWGRINLIEVSRFSNYLLRRPALNQLNRINNLNTNML